MMIFIPFGIYNQFRDSAVIINAATSITQRGSIEPYFVTGRYYSPIGCFSALTFAVLTGITNLLQLSSLPFLVSYLLLPFVTYHFLRQYIVDDERIALLGTIVSIFMDGLAMILLPPYYNQLTESVLNWKIAQSTSSLRFSSLQQIWFQSYKVLGMASAIATCNLLQRKTRMSLFFSGALFFLTFINPRQPFIVFLLLLLLFGMKNINFKDILMLVFSMIVSLGPILGTVLIRFLQYQIAILNSIKLIRDYPKFNRIDKGHH
jgi:hypothetical protein